MSNPRRQFLGLLGAGSLAALGGAALTPRQLAAEAHEAPIDDTFDMSWVDRVSGKYKAVFDSPEISEGAALWRACMWRDNYKTVYGTERSNMSPVIVFRHMGIALVMNDEYWEKYNVGKDAKLKDEKGKWSKVNPIRATPPGMPEKYADYNLTGLMNSGGVVLGCRVAFGEVVAAVKKQEKLDKDAALEKAKSYLVPGVILQPSGVFAVLRAQEAGCSYIKAS